MIANQILQATINKFSHTTGNSCAIYDMNGELLTGAGERLPISKQAVASFCSSQEDEREYENCLLRRARDAAQTQYIAAISLLRENAVMTMELLIYQIESLITAYQDRMDQDSFVKNLLLDNLLLTDIESRARRLHIELETPRVVFLFEWPASKVNAAAMKERICREDEGELAAVLDDDHLAFIWELGKKEPSNETLGNFSAVLRKRIGEEASDIRIAYGSTVYSLRELSKSYKEARLALDVGRIFDPERRVISYHRLGIGRLIYQLPLSLCKLFLSEIFPDDLLNDLDRETLSTIEKFLENNLNVSETSRQLFIHRNTLVYRLDKLQKITGLDLRTFEDAITFKIASMVAQYMRHIEKSGY